MCLVRRNSLLVYCTLLLVYLTHALSPSAYQDTPCIPSNDRAGMSPGGGGEPGPATQGNFLANLSCPLYSRYAPPGVTDGEVLLPSGAFWLNVSGQSD